MNSADGWISHDVSREDYFRKVGLRPAGIQLGPCQSGSVNAMEDELSAVVRGRAGEIDRRVTQPLVDRANMVAEFARHRKRRRALLVRTIDLFPGRSYKDLRVIS